MWVASPGCPAGTAKLTQYALGGSDLKKVESARCPGCSAAVRPDANWCSLCYQDLRPAPRLVRVVANGPSSASGERGQSSPNAPLVEAALEPGPAHLDDLGAAQGVVDADLVDADVVDADAAQRQRAGVPVTPKARLAADVSWPCSCGSAVPLAENTCPDCGGKFLEELQEGANGKHRRRGERSWWPKNRGPRIAFALSIALVVGMGLPILLSLFG